MKLITFKWDGNFAAGYIDSDDAMVCSKGTSTDNDDRLEPSG
jgi:hypothetical protein